METITVTLVLAKSTVGTHVYKEPALVPRDKQTFPTIYVQQRALPDPPPATIEVTIRKA